MVREPRTVVKPPGDAAAPRQLYFTASGQQTFSRVGDVIRRDIDAARHILRRPYARIGFDARAFDQAVADGARMVRVVLRDQGGRTLHAPVETFLQLGRREHFAGHGEQITLALALFADPAQAAIDRAPNPPAQMTLFEER